MGQFKPMVKMETTEPSVMLKLKKGGHVSGHAAMKSTMPMEMADGKFAAPGKAPKKPSIMERRKSMKAPMLMSKKGGDVSQDKAMIKKAFKEHDAQEHKGGKGTKLKLATGGVTNGMKTGGKVSGAAMDATETKTTIEGTEGKFDKTKMERKKTDPSYQRYAAGGTIEGNEGKFDKTKVVSGKKDPGYEKYATGGVVNGMKKGGSTNWENRPADTAKQNPGYEHYATGGLTNPMKKGGAAKKHFATGGAVDTGRAVAMPRKPVSQPVANSLQSGTFKKGGRVVHKADGGPPYPTSDDGYDPIIKREADRRAAEADATRRENESTPVMDSVKRLLGIRPSAGAGRGFVNPLPRKTGGRAKR